MGKKQTEPKKRGRPFAGLTGVKIIAWQLRRQGWTAAQVAQQLGKNINTITRWDAEVIAEMSDLPPVQMAIDMMQALIPESVTVYKQCLADYDIKVRKDAAKDILISHRVLTDRSEHTHKDDRTATSDDLVAEAQRIIAQAD